MSETKESPKVKRAQAKNNQRGERPGDKKVTRVKRTGKGIQRPSDGTYANVRNTVDIGTAQRARHEHWLKHTLPKRIRHNRTIIACKAMRSTAVTELAAGSPARAMADNMVTAYSLAPCDQAVDVRQWAYDVARSMLNEQQRACHAAVGLGKARANQALNEGLVQLEEALAQDHDQKPAAKAS